MEINIPNTINLLDRKFNLHSKTKDKNVFHCFSINHKNKDKTPALRYNSKKNFFHCFVCGISGSSSLDIINHFVWHSYLKYQNVLDKINKKEYIPKNEFLKILKEENISYNNYKYFRDLELNKNIKFNILFEDLINKYKLEGQLKKKDLLENKYLVSLSQDLHKEFFGEEFDINMQFNNQSFIDINELEEIKNRILKNNPKLNENELENKIKEYLEQFEKNIDKNKIDLIQKVYNFVKTEVKSDIDFKKLNQLAEKYNFKHLLNGQKYYKTLYNNIISYIKEKNLPIENEINNIFLKGLSNDLIKYFQKRGIEKETLLKRGIIDIKYESLNDLKNFLAFSNVHKILQYIKPNNPYNSIYLPSLNEIQNLIDSNNLNIKIDNIKQEYNNLLEGNNNISTNMKKILGYYYLSKLKVLKNGNLTFTKQRIIFPFFDENGNIEGSNFRILSIDKNKEGEIIINEKGEKELLDKGRRFTNLGKVEIYGKDLLKKYNTIFITEGGSDALSLIQLGYPAISIPGASRSITEQDLKNFIGKNIIILGDNDEPGKDFINRLSLQLNSISNLISNNEQLPHFFIDEKYNVKDINDFLSKYGKEKTKEFLENKLKEIGIDKLKIEELKSINKYEIDNNIKNININNNTSLFINTTLTNKNNLGKFEDVIEYIEKNNIQTFSINEDGIYDINKYIEWANKNNKNILLNYTLKLNNFKIKLLFNNINDFENIIKQYNTKTITFKELKELSYKNENIKIILPYNLNKTFEFIELNKNNTFIGIDTNYIYNYNYLAKNYSYSPIFINNNSYIKKEQVKDFYIFSKINRNMRITNYKDIKWYENKELLSLSEIKSLNKNNNVIISNILSNTISLVNDLIIDTNIEPIKTKAELPSDVLIDNLKIRIKYQKEWYDYNKRKEYENNKDTLYLFGDNIEDKKTGYQPKKTQAVIRGIKNSFGISTKFNRYTNNNSFMNIEELKENLKKELKELDNILSSGKYKTIIIPEEGIGTGKAIENNPKLNEKEKKEFQKIIKTELNNLLNKYTQVLTKSARYSKNNYEVSSKGDKRFSAFYAKIKDKKFLQEFFKKWYPEENIKEEYTIEKLYQLYIKGYIKEGITNLMDAKGKKPLNKLSYEEIDEEYKKLWKQYLKENPKIFQELIENTKGKTLTDMFADGKVSQAKSLSELVNNEILKQQFKKILFYTLNKESAKKQIKNFPSIVNNLESRNLPLDKIYLDRLKEEIEVFDSFNDPLYFNYFIVLADAIAYAKKQGHIIGYGRGSAAGSLTAYLLGLTEVDPLKHNLLFYRFLNPARKDYPDIDIDLDEEAKKDIEQYLKDKYGRNNVVLLSVLNKVGIKQSVQDILRIHGIKPEETSKITKIYDNDKEEFDKSLKLFLKEKNLEHVYNTILNLVNEVKNKTVHPSALVLTENNIFPYSKIERGLNVLDTDQNGLGTSGIKFDFLSSLNLKIIKEFFNNKKKFFPEDKFEYKPDNINFDEKEVYLYYQNQNFIGIPQYDSESSYYRKIKERLYKIMNIKDLEESSNFISLIRPGANIFEEEYLFNKYKNIIKEDQLINKFNRQIYETKLLPLFKKLYMLDKYIENEKNVKDLNLKKQKHKQFLEIINQIKEIIIKINGKNNDRIERIFNNIDNIFVFDKFLKLKIKQDKINYLLKNDLFNKYNYLFTEVITKEDLNNEENPYILKIINQIKNNKEDKILKILFNGINFKNIKDKKIYFKFVERLKEIQEIIFNEQLYTNEIYKKNTFKKYKTYGTLLYQEQFMEILKEVEISEGDVNNIRKALSKKKKEKIKEYEEIVMKQLQKYGFNEQLSLYLWKKIEQGAEYSFNKSHAISYAMTSFIFMKMKKDYNLLFIQAYNNIKGKVFDIPKENFIERPIINKSNALNSKIIKENKTFKIIPPLKTIDYLNRNKELARIIESLYPFKNLDDFINKVSKKFNINNKIIKTLIDNKLFPEQWLKESLYLKQNQIEYKI